MKNIADLRQDYQIKSLDIKEVASNPFQQFEKWFQEAVEAKVKEPNAMTLATASKDGRPSARIVLLKGIDEGFVFYTNYESQKGLELIKNPFASLVFCWLDMERQIRISGKVEKVSDITSDTYFNKRPKKSRLGAWTSPQSSVIPNRVFLENRYANLVEQYKDTETIPRPEHWGGFRVVPDRVEFWQGRSSRLHDRINYTLQENGTWKIERLAP